MRFATVSVNEDVAALTRRLYRPVSAEGLRDAERALLKANPQLADPARPVPGTVVVVPDVPGATATDEAQSEAQLVTPILQAARDRLVDVAEALRATLDSRRAAVKATVDQIGSAELRQLVREEPTLRDVVAGVSKEAKAEATEIEAMDTLQRQALDELGQDLDELLRTVGGQPPPSDTRAAVTRSRKPRKKRGGRSPDNG